MKFNKNLKYKEINESFDDAIDAFDAIPISWNWFFNWVFDPNDTIEEQVVGSAQWMSLITSFLGKKGQKAAIAIEFVLTLYWIYKWNEADTREEKYQAAINICFGIVVLAVPALKRLRISAKLGKGFASFKAGKSASEIAEGSLKGLSPRMADRARNQLGLAKNGSSKVIEFAGDANIINKNALSKLKKEVDDAFGFLDKLFLSKSGRTVKAASKAAKKAAGNSANLASRAAKIGLSSAAVKKALSNPKIKSLADDALKTDIDPDSILALLHKFDTHPEFAKKILQSIPGRGAIGLINGLDDALKSTVKNKNLAKINSIDEVVDVGKNILDKNFLKNIRIPINGKQVPISKGFEIIENGLKESSKNSGKFYMAGKLFDATGGINKTLLDGVKMYFFPASLLAKLGKFGLKIVKIYTWVNRDSLMWLDEKIGKPISKTVTLITGMEDPDDIVYPTIYGITYYIEGRAYIPYSYPKRRAYTGSVTVPAVVVVTLNKESLFSAISDWDHNLDKELEWCYVTGANSDELIDFGLVGIDMENEKVVYCEIDNDSKKITTPEIEDYVIKPITENQARDIGKVTDNLVYLTEDVLKILLENGLFSLERLMYAMEKSGQRIPLASAERFDKEIEEKIKIIGG